MFIVHLYGTPISLYKWAVVTLYLAKRGNIVFSLYYSGLPITHYINVELWAWRTCICINLPTCEKSMEILF